MFGRSAIHANQVADLKATIERLEHSLEKSQRERDLAKHNLICCHLRVAELQRLLPPSLHKHNFSGLETQAYADMLTQPEQYVDYSDISRSHWLVSGRWSSRGPSQNLPRRSCKQLVSVSFAYKGTRTTFATSETVRSLQVVELTDAKKFRIICNKFDGSRTHYEYDTAGITSEIIKEYN